MPSSTGERPVAEGARKQAVVDLFVHVARACPTIRYLDRVTSPVSNLCRGGLGRSFNANRSYHCIVLMSDTYSLFQCLSIRSPRDWDRFRQKKGEWGSHSRGAALRGQTPDQSWLGPRPTCEGETGSRSIPLAPLP